MAKARNEKAIKAKELFEQGKKLVEIAELLGVPAGTVRRWKSTHKWEGERSVKKSERSLFKNAEKTEQEKIQNEEGMIELIENPELTEKQKLFCCYYVKNFNAVKAYQKAYGCSYKSACSNARRMMENDGIKKEIQNLKQNRLNRDFLTEEDIFQKYMDIAFADMTDFITFGTEEEPVIGQFGPVQVKNPETGKKEQLMQTVNVIRLKESDVVDGTLITEITQGRDGVRVKLADRMKALEWLTSHMDLGTPEQKAKLDKLRAETMRIKGEDPDEETVDDGFLDALNGSAREDWSDEEED